FDRLGDLAGVHAPGALESHVFVEMRQPVALQGLVASARADEHAHGGCAQAGHRIEDDTHAAGQHDDFAICRLQCFATIWSIRLRTKSAFMGPVSKTSLRDANCAARSGKPILRPKARSTVSGNLAACAVDKVTTGPSAARPRRAAARPTAVCGQT